MNAFEHAYKAWREAAFPHGHIDDAVDELHAQLAQWDAFLADDAVPLKNGHPVERAVVDIGDGVNKLAIAIEAAISESDDQLAILREYAAYCALLQNLWAEVDTLIEIEGRDRTRIAGLRDDPVLAVSDQVIDPGRSLGGAKRIYVRPGYWVGACAFLVVTVGALGFFMFLTLSQGQKVVPVFLAALATVQAGFGWIMWRGAQVRVSQEGVSLPSGSGRGLFRLRRLAWSKIDRFEKQEPPGRASIGELVVAKAVDNDPVVVCAVPSHPLFDSVERRRRAVDRVVYLLERERRARNEAATAEPVL